MVCGKTLTRRARVFTLATAGLVMGLSVHVPHADAAIFIKADNTNSLNLASSYTANTVVPGVNDIIQIDSTLTTTRTSNLGGNVSVLGISRLAGPQFQINATSGATLTIGASGISASTATNPLIINNAISTPAAQDWVLPASSTGARIQLNSLSMSGTSNVTVKGGAFLDFRPVGSTTFDGKIETPVSVNNANANLLLTNAASNFDRLEVPTGRLRTAGIANFGVASPIGDGGTSTAAVLGNNATSGLIEYTGANASSNRSIQRDGRSPASGVIVTDASTVLTLTGTISTNTQPQVAGGGWAFSGDGTLALNGPVTQPGASPVGVTKSGSGTLLFNNASNTFTGPVVVTGGRVGGSGKLVAPVTISGSGLLAPGSSVGTLTIENQALTIGGAGAEFEVSKTGSGPFVFSQDVVTGFSSLSYGGVLNILLDGPSLPASSFQSGDAWPLFNLGSVVPTGSFSSVVGPALPVGLSWDFEESTGVLSVIPEPATLGAVVGLAMVCLRRRK